MQHGKATGSLIGDDDPVAVQQQVAWDAAAADMSAPVLGGTAAVGDEQDSVTGEPKEIRMADSTYKPGDVVNGHRLTENVDGSLVWLPLASEPRSKQSRRGLWITLGVVGAVLLLIIIGALNRDPRSDKLPVADATPNAADAESAEAPVVVPDVVGQSASEAASTLASAGLKPAYSGEPDALVLSMSPAAGTELKLGDTVTFVVEEKPKLTMGQQQAIGSATSYLAYTSFSREGLIEQLEYEGFSTEDATFAVDFLAPDWNAQAAASAKSYLEFTSFSRQGLIEQLIYEGFSPEQAEFGVAANGY
ncbi:Ltp family lipoprotein [Leifsonia sp. H3M29-4]|uniref:Ltp family lipoprotein n=1 Tax=Salinibacterium metalliresistens TaxID=3031321 RepID=UPI0023DBB885|nr:Ltp family lipoprotein [Salinibacterium metalliresistens]MDF1479556.1 Ltp family lipoprotein [Salinibacterium metalliresistens]